MNAKSNILFKLKENTNNNIDLIQKAYDYKDMGKREAEHSYKTELLHKARENKEEVKNIKDQYKELLH